MKKIQLSRRLASALPLAATLAAALSLTSTLSANPLDPMDPYDYTAGQFPSMIQNLGLPPQYTGQESIGMRQTRFASGVGNAQQATVISNGAVVLLTMNIAPQGPTGMPVYTNPVTGAQLAIATHPQPQSPIMVGIRTSLGTVATYRGAAAAADGPGTVVAVNNTPYSMHDTLAIYQMRETASSREIDTVQARAVQFAGDQPRLNQALTDIQTTRAKLDTDFAEAQTATPDSWNQIRATLASDYQSYADAVARAEAAANNRSS